MKKVAVVEDNADNRLLVRVLLEPFYSVIEYESGFAALEGLQQQRPDLLLLDVSLPEMDGLEVLRRIRASASLQDLPVIALTAHAMAGDREKYLAAGFDDYITKPILDEKVLLNALQARLSGGATARAAAANESSPLAAAAVERLCRLGGDQFAAEMLGLFLEYADKKIAEARQAHAAGDLVGVEKAMHPIKSSAGNVGAAQVQHLVTRVEQLAKQRQGETLGGLLEEVEQAFRAVKTQLEAARRSLLNKPPG